MPSKDTPRKRRVRQALERPLRRLRHAELPAQPALLSLPDDVWGLVYALVADSPLWFYAVWSFVCKQASQNKCPTSFSALRMDGPQILAIPAARWREWQEITCLTVKGSQTAEVLRFLKETKTTTVPSILIDMLLDEDLKEAAGLRALRGLGNIYYRNDNQKPAPRPCQSWLSSCTSASEEAILAYLQVKKPRTLVLDYREALSANLCRTIGELTELRQLDLSASRVPGAWGWLAALTQLRYLNLNDCLGVTDATLGHLAGLANLRSLCLRFCPYLSPAGLTQLAGLQKLRYLNLAHPGSITDLDFVNGLTRLRELILGYCNVDDNMLYSLSDLQDLRVLDLSGNRNITSAGLAGVAQLTRLQELNLGFCNRVTSAGLQNLSGLQHCLQKLDLRGCTLDDFRSLAGLGALQDLSLSLSQANSAELAYYLPVKLQKLTLDCSPQVDGQHFRHLSRLVALRELQVSCKNLASPAIRHLTTLPKLQALEFLFCSALDDSVFEYFRLMHNLQKLIVYGSKISASAAEVFQTERPGCKIDCM